MYRRIALTIALALSLISLSLVSSDSTVRAQKPSRYTADTGVVTLGPDQILRITVAIHDTGTHEVKVQFRSISYLGQSCDATGVCVNEVSSQTTSDPMTVTPYRGLSKNFYSASEGRWVRGVVVSNSKDVRVTSQIIDTATGNVVTSNNIECSYFES
ncbi:MAG TPA: hypothetical protein VJV21_02150 [Pyrinomonadaceae bacterium]|nr:hypothetical protein [Pyrinomonadaceae bacterium]